MGFLQLKDKIAVFMPNCQQDMELNKELMPATSLSADWCSINWANQAAVLKNRRFERWP